MSLPESHELSRKLSDRLDDLGYSTARVAKRVHDWKKMSEAKTKAAQAILKQDKIEKLHVGSHGEGIALAYESDTDILQANHSVVCVDNLEDFKYGDNIVFLLDRERAPAGYTYLPLSNKGNIKAAYMSELKHALTGKKKFLSSEKFLRKNQDIFSKGTGYISKNTVYHSISGPAIPKTWHDRDEEFRNWWFDSNFNEDVDFVQSFPCLCPDLMQSWSVRPRHHHWPSKEVIEHVKSLQSYVVPVGKKGSHRQDLQWRISFTPAEMYLVHSLNDTQRKVLILLRHIAKHRLKPICPDITSYIVKNVIFWMSEEIPLNQFQSHLLLDRLVDSLTFLNTCISKRSLQNYMIPGRDLLQDKPSHSEQRKFTKEMSNMIAGVDVLYSQIMEMISQLSNRLSFLNGIDKISAEVAGLFTTEKLTEFYICSAECSNPVQYTMCYDRFITRPYERTYMRKIPCRMTRSDSRRMHVSLLRSARTNSGGRAFARMLICVIVAACVICLFGLYFRS